MKKLLLLLVAFGATSVFAQTPCSGGFAGSYPCNGITLQSYISAATMGAAEAQDSWGWTDVDGDGREYAIVALDNGTAFVDITNPTSPVYLARLNTHSSSSLWRDVKIYNNHAYIVSEASNHGMQIFDLKRLRTLTGSPVVTFTKTQTDGNYNGITTAHNLIINEDSGFAYILGSNVNSGAPRILNLSNPISPTVAGDISSTLGYCHDAQVVIYDGPDPDHQGKEILIGSFSGSDFVKILDVSNKTSVTQISSIGYINKYYTHQGWFTEDKRFFIVGDEVDESSVGFNTRTLVFDLQDLDNPVLHHTYYGPTAAIDHNGYVRGNRFYLANYAAGMRILKVDGLYETVPSMTEVNYFDTFPSSNAAGFNATWNVYPFFASGNLIATGFGDENVSGDGGLFVLRDPNYDNTAPIANCQNFTAILDKNTATVTITATDIDNGSTDNMGIVKRTLTGQTTFTCADVGSSFNVTLTVEDDYGNKSSCVALVTVAGETTAYTSAAGGSWSNGTPGIGSNAKISADYNTSIGSNSSFDACTCEIDTGSTLTIAANDHVNITKDITVNGSLIVKHTGSVVQEDPTASVIKNPGAVINVELTTPILQTRDFMVMGSPMDSEMRNGVYNSAFLVLQHTPANFIPHPGVPPGGTNFADDNNDFWSAYNGAITVGEGFIVRPQSGYTDPANTTFDMTYTLGTLNNGDVTRPIVYNGATNPSGTPNVFGNPYASAISANAFISANPLINEVYFWEHLTPPSPSIPGAGSMNFSMDDVSMYNLSGGVKAANDPGTTTQPNGVIATGQGFAIKAFGAGTATFTNNMRLTSGNTTLRSPSAPETIDRLWLTVKNNEYELGSTALLAFNPDATAEFDPGYDSNRLATVISLYSHMDNGTGQMGIQTRGSFEDGIKIPVGFATQVDTSLEYTISISNFDGNAINNATVFLIDNLTNSFTNLSETDYTFVSGKGQFDNRFTVLFEMEPLLGPTDSVLEHIVLFPNPVNQILTIHSPNAFIKNIEIFDIRGRRMAEKIEEDKNTHSLDLVSLETGVYFVKVYTDSGVVTKKIIKS